MPAAIEIESTLTDRYQTTVPEPVRRALRLGKRDKIHYSIQADGAVLITRPAPQEESDPELDAFLGFLARDIAANPQQIQILDASLVGRIRSWVSDMDVNLDAPLSVDDE